MTSIQVFLLILTLTYLVKGQPQHNDERNVIPNGFSWCDDVTPCEEGYSCHPSQGLCYKDPAPVDRPHVWLGVGPDQCHQMPPDCSYFGMDYDVSHPHGNGEWCNEGEKVRCIVKENPSSRPPTPANELQVVSYNAFERAWFISIDGQRERTCRIPYVFARDNPDVDVITFQEVFMEGCWPEQASIRDLLEYYGYPYSTQTIRSDLWYKFENGGIFIASKWPIIEEDQYVFKNAMDFSADMFAAKGVSYAKINKTVGDESRVYHVMGTHFQAGGEDEVQHGQAMEWAEFVKSLDIPYDEPLVYTGDLNANVYTEPEHFYYIMDILQAELPVLQGSLNGTLDRANNDLLQLKNNKTGKPKWIDHVVYSLQHAQPITAYNEVLQPRDHDAFPVCWCEQCINILRWDYVYPDPESCDGRGDIEYVRDLSNHFPLLGVFLFP